MVNKRVETDTNNLCVCCENTLTEKASRNSGPAWRLTTFPNQTQHTRPHTVVLLDHLGAVSEHHVELAAPLADEESPPPRLAHHSPRGGNHPRRGVGSDGIPFLLGPPLRRNRAEKLRMSEDDLSDGLVVTDSRV